MAGLIYLVVNRVSLQLFLVFCAQLMISECCPSSTAVLVVEHNCDVTIYRCVFCPLNTCIPEYWQ